MDKDSSATRGTWLDGLRVGDLVAVVDERAFREEEKVTQGTIHEATSKYLRVAGHKYRRLDGQRIMPPGKPSWAHPLYLVPLTAEVARQAQIRVQVLHINGLAHMLTDSNRIKKLTQEQLDQVQAGLEQATTTLRTAEQRKWR